MRSRADRIRTVTVGAVTLAVALPSIAAATAKDHDPRGDFQNHSSWRTQDVDIVKLAHRERGGKLTHVVKLDGKAPHPEPREDEPSPPGLAINTGPGGGGEGCAQLGVTFTGAEYVVASIARSKPWLVNCETGETTRIKSRKRGGHKFVYTFNKRKIGSPRRYGWRAETSGYDVAPNESDWLRHRLRGGTDTNRARSRWKKCGDLQESGAGAYDVRAKRTSCGTAKRVANHWVWKGGYAEPDRKWHGWKCRSRRTGYENHRTGCVKRKSGTKRKVKFEHGA